MKWVVKRAQTFILSHSARGGDRGGESPEGLKMRKRPPKGSHFIGGTVSEGKEPIFEPGSQREWVIEGKDIVGERRAIREKGKEPPFKWH